jgi:hypothetical protein
MTAEGGASSGRVPGWGASDGRVHQVHRRKRYTLEEMPKQIIRVPRTEPLSIPKNQKGMLLTKKSSVHLLRDQVYHTIM